ncbi:hypothetical protein TomTYG75_27360 [Sphingobium sp. TomTYG75]|jgi:hypothetical protein
MTASTHGGRSTAWFDNSENMEATVPLERRLNFDPSLAECRLGEGGYPYPTSQTLGLPRDNH